MAEVLVINGHDWSRLVQRTGLGWSRNDLDSEKTTRTKDGKMRRDKICTKRKVSFKTLPATREQLAALDDDLSAETFSATYLDLHGKMTKTFYCTSFSVPLEEVTDSQELWGEGSFSIIEV